MRIGTGGTGFGRGYLKIKEALKKSFRGGLRFSISPGFMTNSIFQLR